MNPSPAPLHTQAFEERPMGEFSSDRDLAILYWKLQRSVHTNPGIRGYLCALTEILRERRIKAATLNAIGLELVVNNQL